MLGIFSERVVGMCGEYTVLRVRLGDYKGVEREYWAESSCEDMVRNAGGLAQLSLRMRISWVCVRQGKRVE